MFFLFYVCRIFSENDYYVMITFLLLFITFLQVPSSEDDWKTISEDFNNQWNFPNPLGALDGNHVVIVASQHSGSVYYNYKGTFNIVLMALIDANYKFIYTRCWVQWKNL